MCAGVTRGLAGRKLSECPSRFGAKQTNRAKKAKTTKKIKASLSV